MYSLCVIRIEAMHETCHAALPCCKWGWSFGPGLCDDDRKLVYSWSRCRSHTHICEYHARSAARLRLVRCWTHAVQPQVQHGVKRGSMLIPERNTVRERGLIMFLATFVLAPYQSLLLGKVEARSERQSRAWTWTWTW